MRFFSKIVFICNLCFIASVILRWIEMMKKKPVRPDEALTLNPLKSTLVILGYGAILINIVFNVMILLYLLRKKEQVVAKWMIWFNFLLLLGQVYYFFFF